MGLKGLEIRLKDYMKIRQKRLRLKYNNKKIQGHFVKGDRRSSGLKRRKMR
jgi:hypothetical protein